MSKKKPEHTVVSQDSKSYSKVIKLFFIGLILFLYGRTVTYDFVLDDGLFITNNPTVNKGIAGIGEAFTQGSLLHFKGGNFQTYRPILISFFSVEKQFFGLNSRGFHFMNIVLYSLLALVIYSLIKRLFPKLNPFYQVLIVTLFIIHPIHTEVVANVKSQDELLSALFNLSALVLLFKFEADNSKKQFLLVSVFCFLLALFSKESSLAFVVLFPISLFLLNKNSIKESLVRSAPYFLAGIFFLLCRHSALKGVFTDNETTVLENVLYGAKDWGMILGTKLEIAFYYLKMMLFPYPMSWDYSFNQIPLMTITEFIPLVSLAAYLIIGILIIFNLKKRPEIAFGLLFFIILIAPTANVFFFNGATFADRFLFLPSLGFIVAFIYLVLQITRMNSEEIPATSKKYIYIVSAIIVLVSFSLTRTRIPDWKNEYAVFKSGAAHSPNSSRTVIGLGTYYMNMAEASTDESQRNLYIDSATTYIKKSLAIFPDNYSASYKLGLIYSIINDKQKSKSYYRQSLRSKPSNVQTLNNIGAVYASEARFDSAYYYFDKAYKIDALNDMTLTNITIATFNNGQNDKAILYGEEAMAKGLGNSKVCNILSLAYAKAGNSEKANKYKLQAKMMGIGQ
ncbi:glycosyltransferase family 39 protein [Flavobacterium sp.]|uniref:glycosyltransferase family 39 protein n=1 Tax=Flavobacterium sp. TaxID=239 RepID=UPI002FD9BC9D